MEDEKAKRKLGALDTKHCALFLCDIQEKFEKSIDKFQMVVSNAERVAKAANILGIPILATEQYPKVNEYRIRGNRTPLLIRTPGATFQVHRGQF